MAPFCQVGGATVRGTQSAPCVRPPPTGPRADPERSAGGGSGPVSLWEVIRGLPPPRPTQTRARAHPPPSVRPGGRGADSSHRARPGRQRAPGAQG